MSKEKVGIVFRIRSRQIRIIIPFPGMLSYFLGVWNPVLGNDLKFGQPNSRNCDELGCAGCGHFGESGRDHIPVRHGERNGCIMDFVGPFSPRK